MRRGKQGGSGGEDAMRCWAGVGPGLDRWAAPRPYPCRPRRARAARSVSTRSGRHRVTDVWDLASSGGGREQREARGMRGLTRERTRWAEPG
jgi:hypothetical protein